ncbi:hypothetical protein U1Q18_043859, partial [Sarracenia purpurea var. burkii]
LAYRFVHRERGSDVGEGDGEEEDGNQSFEPDPNEISRIEPKIGDEGETAPEVGGGEAAAAVVNGGEQRRGRGRIG